MKLRTKLGRIESAVLFVAACATTALACDSGGYPDNNCYSDTGTGFGNCAVICPDGYYACCNSGWFSGSCTCIQYGC